MFPRKFIRRFSVIVGLISVIMLSAAPTVDANSVVAENESTLDEPRYTQTVVPQGPYRLIIPTPSRLSDKIVTEPPGPKWINNEYKIKAGDSLSKIAPALGHSYVELAKCSGITNPHRISIGQSIRKPGVNCVAPAPVTVTTPDHTTHPSSGIVETVIAFAMAQLGDPYYWGGNGPNSWDCSGLVHAAFANAGISTTRSTKTLINEGMVISRGEMVRGDLVFPSSGHVGIYLGNNQMIHAPQAGDVVKISSVYDFYAARRVA